MRLSGGEACVRRGSLCGVAALSSRSFLSHSFNSFSSYDTDDCSAYHHMTNSVQVRWGAAARMPGASLRANTRPSLTPKVYGHGLKSDFSGHDIVFENDLSIWGDGGDQYQPLVHGYYNGMHNSTLLAKSEGDVLISHVCPDAVDWPIITDTTVLSPAGNVTVCARSVASWQAQIPGVLARVVTGPLPAALTAEAIVQMARDTLAGVPSKRQL